MKKKHLYIISVLIIFVLIISGCSKDSNVKYVNLSDLQSVSYSQTNPKAKLRVALAIGLSPSQSIARYQAVTNYLSDRLNRPIELVQRKTYEEVDNLIQKGQVDIAFVCSSSYVIGREKFGERLIAVPIKNGSPYYQSAIIANSQSGIKEWSDLKGRSFAFSDPQSTSGALYALSQLKDRGGLSFLENYIFTFSHSDTITAVNDRLVDAAAVDANTLQRAFLKTPEFVDNIKIIDVSPLYANNPVVASPRLDEKTFIDVQRALLDMDKDTLGKEALEIAKIDNFKLLENDMYDSVRKLVDEVEVLGGSIYEP